MGVKGLYTFCKTNKSLVSSEEDLVLIAKDNPVTIHIHLDNFIYCLKETAIELQPLADIRIPKILCYVGSYNIYEDLLTSFLDCFQKCNINVIFYKECARGSNSKIVTSKLFLWGKRYLAILKNHNEWQVQGNDILDILMEDLIRKILKTKKCKVIYSAGDVKQEIAKQFVPNSYDIVLSKNTDFCLLKNTRMVYYSKDMWDLSGCLKQAYKTKSTSIKELKVRVITREKIAERLNITILQLLDVAAMCGNDFTVEFLPLYNNNYFDTFVKKLKNMQGFASKTIEVEKLALILENPGIKEALQSSREYYELNFTELTEDYKSPLGAYLYDQVMKGSLPDKTLAYHCGYNFCRILIENPSGPSIECAFRGLTTLMSSMCIDSDEMIIKEYGRSDHGESNFKITKLKVNSDLGLPYLSYVPEMSLTDRLLLFSKIFLYQEAGAQNAENLSTTYFGEISDPVKAMICFILHHLINIQEQLKFTDKELSIFLITIIIVMKKQHLPIQKNTFENLIKWKPITLKNRNNFLKCLTNSSWFQMTVKYCNLLSEMLNLGDDFILDPTLIFDGALFANLYMEIIVKENKLLEICEIKIPEAITLSEKRSKIWEFFCLFEQFISENWERKLKEVLR